jgi:hypothetical protein
MQLEVVVLRDKTTHPLENWMCRTDADGRIWVYDLLGELSTKKAAEACWRDLALKISGLSSPQKVDVFLRLEIELAEQIHDVGPLEEVITLAQKYSWGGNIYVEWNQEKNSKFRPSDHSIFLRNWLTMLADRGISALIEMPKKEAKDSNKFVSLRRCAGQAEDRRNHLQAAVNGGNWAAVVDSDLEGLLIELAKTGLIPLDGPNEIIFYAPRSKQLRKLHKKSGEAKRKGSQLLTAAVGVDTESLQEWWDSKPLFFNGTLEWLYSFIRLNSEARVLSPPQETTSENVIWIEADEPGHLRPAGYLNLLITAAFDANSQPDHCIAAAEQVGDVLRNVPFHVNTTIYPYVTCDQIPKILANNSFTVWLHISHGTRDLGLYEGRSQEHAQLKRWEASIPARGGGLQLVILSACESDDIARALAAKGVRVAIGYGEDVRAEAAKQVAERVVPEALQKGDRQEAILRAFNYVCEQLRHYTETHDSEIRRYADALPRAFAIQGKQA